jgi:hypothetical protein
LPSQSSLPKKSGDSGSRSGSSFGLEAFTINLTARGRETRVALDLARRAGTERAAIGCHRCYGICHRKMIFRSILGLASSPV